jgi:hypothetical protein
MRFVGHVACIEGEIYVKFWSKNLNIGDQLGDVGICGQII